MLAMDLAPDTMGQVRQVMADRPKLRFYLAGWWILVGGLSLAAIGAVAVAHYAYDMPIYDTGTGALSTPANTLRMFLVLGAASALFLIIGILFRRWKPI
jgi:hypothetical protein